MSKIKLSASDIASLLIHPCGCTKHFLVFTPLELCDEASECDELSCVLKTENVSKKHSGAGR
jgi:hypothetical protein